MPRFDIRESPKAFGLLALIVMVFLIVPLVVRSPAAETAAALDNLEIAIGATTYRIPRLTVEGGDLAAIASVFQTGGASLDTRLAGFSAPRLVIPELLSETRVGDVIARARYRDVILTDVAAGRVAVAHARAAEQTVSQADGREARLDWRGLSFRGVDLRQLARVLASGATANPAEPPKPVLEEEVIDSVGYESLSGDVSLRAGRLTLAAVKARPPAASSPPPPPGLKELAQAAGAIAFERFEVQNLEIDGRVPDAPAPFTLRIDRIALRGLTQGVLAGATLDHVALATPEGGTATLAQLGLRDVALGALGDGGAPEFAEARAQDVAIDLPTPQTGPSSRLRSRLAGAHVELGNFRARLPTKFVFGVDRLFVDLAARGDAGLAAPLRALGYQSVDLSVSAAGGWDEKTGDVVLAPARIAAKDMVAATLSATLGNVSALAFSSSPALSRAAASAASIKSIDLTLEGGEAIARLLAQQPSAPKQGFDAAQTLREAIAQNLGAGPNARRVSDALADYLRTPQRLHLRLAGKPSINALDLMARKPADIFEGLEIEATTGAGASAQQARPEATP